MTEGLEAPHLSFSLLHRLVREFCTVVEAFVLAVLNTLHDWRLRHGITLQLISDQQLWYVTQALE